MKIGKFAVSPSTVFCIALTLTGLGFAPGAVAEDTNPARIGPNATLTFMGKASMLTPESRNQLDQLLREATLNGRMIQEVQVASWSDNPAPRKGERLSKPDRTLAERRGDAVKKYIRANSKAGVTNYNMAERASWLAKTFDTSDSELKAEMGQGGNRRMSRDEFQVFKNGGQPSRSVVLVILKH